MIIDNSINKLGSELKKKIIELIKKENINIEYTYEASFKQSGSFSFVLNKENHIIPRKIIVPKLIDSDLKQAIIMAHELGHYYVYKNNSKIKNNLIVRSENPNVIYHNEKRAWKEAERIIDNLGYWQDDVAFFFEVECFESLRSYQPQNHLFITITRPIYHLAKYWAVSYLIISLLYLMSKNGIPIPIPLILSNTVVEINRIEFFNGVNGLFIIFLIIKLICLVFSLYTKKSPYSLNRHF